MGPRLEDCGPHPALPRWYPPTPTKRTGPERATVGHCGRGDREPTDSPVGLYSRLKEKKARHEPFLRASGHLGSQPRRIPCRGDGLRLFQRNQTEERVTSLEVRSLRSYQVCGLPPPHHIS